MVKIFTLFLIFIHSAAGISRSATIVISYLISAKKMSYLEGYDYLKSKRPIICPNNGFRKQLMEYSDKVNSRRSKTKICYQQ